MTNPFSSGSNPFEFLLGDLLKMLGSQAGAQSDMARQMAISVASESGEQANVDPIERIKFEELSKILAFHIDDFGAIPHPEGLRRGVEVVTKVEWAAQTVADWDPFANLFKEHTAIEAESGSREDAVTKSSEQDSLAQMIQNLSKMVGPSMVAMQMGSMIGHLARVAFGSFEIPVPRSSSSVPMLISRNIDAFASEWELPQDQVRLWATLRDLVTSAIVSSPKISKHLGDLFTSHIRASNASLKNVQERLSQLDLSDPEALQSALSDPSGIFSSDGYNAAQLKILEEISITIAVIEGLAHNAATVIGGRLLGNIASIDEAFMRRRIERSEGERLSEQFFGIEISRSALEKGQGFVAGVIDRAGESGIGPIWERDGTFPTMNELEAPGLWLARLEFDE